MAPSTKKPTDAQTPDTGLTVAVTGPTGEIGRSLLAALERSDQVKRVLGMARRPFDPAEYGWKKVEYRRGDVLDRSTVDELVAGADVVVHLAFIIFRGIRLSPRQSRGCDRGRHAPGNGGVLLLGAEGRARGAIPRAGRRLRHRGVHLPAEHRRGTRRAGADQRRRQAVPARRAPAAGTKSHPGHP